MILLSGQMATLAYLAYQLMSVRRSSRSQKYNLNELILIWTKKGKRRGIEITVVKTVKYIYFLIFQLKLLYTLLKGSETTFSNYVWRHLWTTPKYYSIDELYNIVTAICLDEFSLEFCQVVPVSMTRWHVNCAAVRSKLW